MDDKPNYITPAGYRRCARNMSAVRTERPKLVETISWAPGTATDPRMATISTGRKRLGRSIGAWAGSRSGWRPPPVLDPARQETGRVFSSGATVTLVDENESERVVTLVGDDEADASAARISWNSPVARAIREPRIGDLRRVTLPAARRNWKSSLSIYPETGSAVPPRPPCCAHGQARS
jgi:transcription elongation factor GreB